MGKTAFSSICRQVGVELEPVAIFSLKCQRTACPEDALFRSRVDSNSVRKGS